jgi:hypothetical protein
MYSFGGRQVGGVDDLLYTGLRDNQEVRCFF